MSRCVPWLAKHKSSVPFTFMVLFRQLVRQNPLATKAFNLHLLALLRRFGRGIKFIYCQFTFMITRPKCFQKPLQTLVDGNLRNIFCRCFNFDHHVHVHCTLYQCKRWYYMNCTMSHVHCVQLHMAGQRISFQSDKFKP